MNQSLGSQALHARPVHRVQHSPLCHGHPGDPQECPLFKTRTDGAESFSPALGWGMGRKGTKAVLFHLFIRTIQGFFSLFFVSAVKMERRGFESVSQSTNRSLDNVWRGCRSGPIYTCAEIRHGRSSLAERDLGALFPSSQPSVSNLRHRGGWIAVDNTTGLYLCPGLQITQNKKGCGQGNITYNHYLSVSQRQERQCTPTYCS